MTMPKVENSKIGTMVNCILLLGLCALSWYWGFQLGATALTDPDSCWLSAVGKWIWQHAALPSSDPYSWTFAAGRPAGQAAHYLPYQWLSSLLFFAVLQNLGPCALLFLATLLVVSAFLLLPLALARRLGAPLALQAILSALAVSAGSFHFPLRPELFSYLFISLLFFVLLPRFVRPSQSPSGFAKPLLLGLSIFVLWTNLHSGFVLGLLIVLVFFLASVLIGVGAKQAEGNIGYMSLFSLAALVGTLLTPFQFKLYEYLPGLFFSPINKYNFELMPLRFEELLSFDYLPFLALQVIFVCAPIITYAILKKKNFAKAGGSDPVAFSVSGKLVIVLGVFTALLFLSGDMCRRMIPFAVLMSLAYFLVLANKTQIGGRSFWPLKYVLPLVLVLALWGTEMSSSRFPAEIPQKTFGFDVPRAALVFIQKSRPAGNLLNDAQFGDVLIFALDEKARVFIDTRFDFYGPQFCRDYFVLVNGLPGYEALLAHYKIDWIFLPPRAALLHRLAETGNWTAIFKDDAAIILVKKQGQ